MKTKIKRHSRSVLSVVLALCMLLSCMTAGMIMTDAAKVDSETVGADGWAVVFYNGSNEDWHNLSGNSVDVTLAAGSYSFKFVYYNNGANTPYGLGNSQTISDSISNWTLSKDNTNAIGLTARTGSADEVNKIKTHNGELLKVSKPVYFTIYEMATIENGTTYTGQGES